MKLKSWVSIVGTIIAFFNVGNDARFVRHKDDVILLS